MKNTSFNEVKYTDIQNGYCIDIGNDVWIGKGVMITDGVTIGDGAVVGACSLVLSDIEPYAIYAGSPARKVGERFDGETVRKLMEIRWWDKGEEWIEEHAKLFCKPEEFLRTI